MTKLNNKKIKYIINQVTKKNQNTKTMAEIYDITRRRGRKNKTKFKKTGEKEEMQIRKGTFGSLLHGDWHRTTENHPYAIVWLDDASYDARV